MADQFIRQLHPDTRLIVGVRDILSAPTEAIVNPANGGLSHGGGVAALIADAAGEKLEKDCERIIRKLRRVPTTLAVPTSAGNLPFKYVLHAVGPRMGDGDEHEKIKKTILNVMRLAFKLDLTSVGFPAISTGLFRVPIDIFAKAFINGLDEFWADESNRVTQLVWLCLTIDKFPFYEKEMNC